MLKAYYRLTKPGIIYGNILTAFGGFLLAAHGNIHYETLIGMLLGTSFVIGSACVFNNYFDRDIDALMARTKKRALVTKQITPQNALFFGTVLFILGIGVLSIYTNVLVVDIGLVAFFVYVILYGRSKRLSVHGTLVGSIAGAAPIVAGYCAVTDKFDGGAIILFFILALWQMPHFYSIAMYRLKDYKSAAIPVHPIKRGTKATRRSILLYIIAFTVACACLSFYGYAGSVFLVVMIALGAIWFWKGFRGIKTTDQQVWARKMFLFSLIVIVGLSTMLSFNALL